MVLAGLFLQVLLPVGEAPEEVFQRYASLIVRHRQVQSCPSPYVNAHWPRSNTPHAAPSWHCSVFGPAGHAARRRWELEPCEQQPWALLDVVAGDKGAAHLLRAHGAAQRAGCWARHACLPARWARCACWREHPASGASGRALVYLLPCGAQGWGEGEST
jgi:hypothetical protein